MIHEILYKRTTDGAIQTWRLESEGDSYRTHSGQLNGKLVISSWKKALPKNVGKKNETTGEQQALAEVKAEYKKRLELNYTANVDDIDNIFFFSPMLAKSYTDYPPTFRDPVWSQPKLDGIRCIATAKGLFSRKGKRIFACPHVSEALEPVFSLYPDAILDGELYSHSLKEDFNTLVSLIKRAKPSADDIIASSKVIQYHVYDIPSEATFQSRYDNLVNAVVTRAIPNGVVQLVDTDLAASQDELDNLYGSYLESGYEGQMIRFDGPGYENKRTRNLLKRKEFQDQEYEIVEITAGVGNRSEVAGRVVCRLPNGGAFGAGIRGSFEYAARLLEEAELYRGGTASIRFQNLTPDSIPRFPVCIAVYTGERDC